MKQYFVKSILLALLGLISFSSCKSDVEKEEERSLVGKKFYVSHNSIGYDVEFVNDHSIVFTHEISSADDELYKTLSEEVQKDMLENIQSHGKFPMKYYLTYNYDFHSGTLFLHKDKLAVEASAKKLAGIDDGLGDAIVAIGTIGIGSIINSLTKSTYVSEFYKGVVALEKELGDQFYYNWEKKTLKSYKTDRVFTLR